MPKYMIETTYRLPIFRQRCYEAETPEAACRLAIEDEDWSDQKEDYETSGETYVTGVWAGVPAIAVPAHFDETVSARRTCSGRCLSFWGSLHDQWAFPCMTSSVGSLSHRPSS